jgi:PAS domain S-box-containing protein
LEARHIPLTHTDQHVPIDYLSSLLLKTTHDAIIMRNFTDQSICLWNQEAETLYGRSAQEAVGQHYSTLLHPHVLSGSIDSDDILGREGEWQGELTQIRSDGQQIIVHSHQTLMYDQNGKLTLVLEVNHDLTERKHLEQDMKEYVQLATTAGDLGLWSYNLSTEQEEITSYHETELTPLPAGTPIELTRYQEFVHPDDRQRSLDTVKQAIQTHQDYIDEIRWIEPDGKIRWLSIRGRPMYDEQGRPQRMLGIASDITERKRMEETLRASETKFRRLVDANIVGIIVTTLSGQILEANDTFLSLVGYTREELMAGQLSWRAITPPEYQQISDEVVQELRQYGVCRPIEKAYITKEGKQVWVLLAAARLDETTDHNICFILDMTEHKELEKQRELLVGVISHELRTPLTAIKGNIQLAQRRFQRYVQNSQSRSAIDSSSIGKIEVSLEQALRQIRVQERLINDLLESTRIEDGNLTITRQPSDLPAIIRETMEDMHFISPTRTLQLEFPQQETLQINADPGRIGQVLANYIINAFKYSPEDSPVRIGMTREEQAVRVWVRDEGPGIPAEVQAHIWDRFYRIPGPKGHDGAGKSFGLGLHICR